MLHHYNGKTFRKKDRSRNELEHPSRERLPIKTIHFSQWQLKSMSVKSASATSYFKICFINIHSSRSRKVIDGVNVMVL